MEKNVSKFHEDFIKNYDEDGDKGCRCIFLNVFFKNTSQYS